MTHPNCDYFNFIDNNTPGLLGLKQTIDYLNTKLSAQAKDKIRAANLHLFYSIGPGCITKVRLEPGETIHRLIIIDKTLTSDLLKFSMMEIAAELLHEVGHFLNAPEENEKHLEEFYADDFARALGMGHDLKKGFKKYLSVIEAYTDEETGKYFFIGKQKQDQIVSSLKERAERIENEVPILRGSTKTD